MSGDLPAIIVLHTLLYLLSPHYALTDLMEDGQ